MQDALAQLAELSNEAPDWLRYTLVVLGLALIMTGGRIYRFWFAAGVTFLAGIWGIIHGGEYGLSSVVAGLLVAAGVGCVALALTRLVVFMAGGWLCWQIASLAIKDWANPLVCFTVGGMLSTLTFGLVVRLVTSGLGVMLIALGFRWIGAGGEIQVLSGLWERVGGNSAGWAWLGATLVAASFQALIDRGIDWWRSRREEAKKKAAEKKEVTAQAA